MVGSCVPQTLLTKHTGKNCCKVVELILCVSRTITTCGKLAWGLSRAGLELGFSVLELFEVKCVNS